MSKESVTAPTITLVHLVNHFPPTTKYVNMISLKIKSANIDCSQQISQSYYDRLVEQFLSQDIAIKSSCCSKKVRFTRHATYDRWVKDPITSTKIRLTIVRVRCSSCGKTHALLPIEIIPYKQIELCTAVNLIQMHEDGEQITTIMNNSPEIIDFSDYYRLINQYNKNWRERINVIKEIIKEKIRKNIYSKITVCSKLKDFLLKPSNIRECIAKYSSFFLQMRGITNYLEITFT